MKISTLPYTINCKGRLLEFNRPLVMGILNVTPDSFYDGSCYNGDLAIGNRIEQMLEEGVDIIDLGAMSTKPGSVEVSPEEEMQRLRPALKMFNKYFPEAIVSVDTYRANIAREVVEKYGVAMLNDISAGELDPTMLQTIAELKVPYVMMHIKGTPQTMQNSPRYDDLVQEVMLFFAEKMEQARLLGISDVIIDPGFGFGKTVEHNYELMRQLGTLKILEKPILVGISRKSMIYKVLETDPEHALTGTIALNMAALLNGADIIRVHDVRDAVQTVKIFNQLKA